MNNYNNTTVYLKTLFGSNNTNKPAASHPSAPVDNLSFFLSCPPAPARASGNLLDLLTAASLIEHATLQPGPASTESTLIDFTESDNEPLPAISSFDAPHLSKSSSQDQNTVVASLSAQGRPPHLSLSSRHTTFSNTQNGLAISSHFCAEAYLTTPPAHAAPRMPSSSAHALAGPVVSGAASSATALLPYVKGKRGRKSKAFLAAMAASAATATAAGAVSSPVPSGMDAQSLPTADVFAGLSHKSKLASRQVPPSKKMKLSPNMDLSRPQLAGDDDDNDFDDHNDFDDDDDFDDENSFGPRGACRNGLLIGGYRNRTSHNLLEKTRRAHMKNRFDRLYSVLPEKTKPSTISILHCASNWAAFYTEQNKSLHESLAAQKARKAQLSAKLAALNKAAALSAQTPLPPSPSLLKQVSIADAEEAINMTSLETESSNSIISSLKFLSSSNLSLRKATSFDSSSSGTDIADGSQSAAPIDARALTTHNSVYRIAGEYSSSCVECCSDSDNNQTNLLPRGAGDASHYTKHPAHTGPYARLHALNGRI